MRLSSLDTSSFPHLTAYLDVHDAQGAFVHGISAKDVSMQEGKRQIPVSELQEQKPGVQFVVAITPGESFTIRDGQGISRYDYLLQGILAGSWKDEPPGGDDFSLITMGGPQLTHSSDPEELADALEEYPITGTLPAPDLQVLASALQVAAETSPHPGMERAILFITPPHESESSLGLQSIITSAVQQNIHIYVWLVAAPEVFDLPEIDQLRSLAVQTQAAFFSFSHDEPVPDLESILEPLRYLYKVEYDSHVTEPGTQQVFAQVSANGEVFASSPLSFEIDLQPPAISLLSPPGEIVRSFSVTVPETARNANTDLEPSKEVLNIRVTFPDGYERNITRTSLYVDGMFTSENSTPPFDHLVWDLRPYFISGVHTLNVEAADSLGLVGQSAKIRVKITNPSVAQSVWVEIGQNRLLIMGAMLVISLSILILVLILGGRIRPKPYPGQVDRQSTPAGKSHSGWYRIHTRADQVIPVQSAEKGIAVPPKYGSRFSGWLKRVRWFKSKEKLLPALAYLIPLAGHDEITIPAPLQVISDEATLGSDPHQANLVITDPSIEALHARIQHKDSWFMITDAGTVAGTWVNFSLVPPEGARIEHADIIHLGQVGFRFNLATPGKLRKVVVTPLERER